jgi:hypothetical protein
MPGKWGGSSGQTSAARIGLLIDTFLSLPVASQTSQAFATLWTNRSTLYLDVPLDYIIGGGEGNSASGWSSYVYRLFGSTRNTSSGGTYAIRGLPDQPMRDFRADRTVLQAATSAISGTGDAAQGQRLYQFLVSTVITTGRYNRGGSHQEILIAWAAVGSSAAPTS